MNRQQELERIRKIMQVGDQERLQPEELELLLARFTPVALLRELTQLGLLRKMSAVEKRTGNPIYKLPNEATIVLKAQRKVRLERKRWGAYFMMLATQLNALGSDPNTVVQNAETQNA